MAERKRIARFEGCETGQSAARDHHHNADADDDFSGDCGTGSCRVDHRVERGAGRTAVTITFNGATIDGVLTAGGAAFVPLTATGTGSFTADLTAPDTDGTYPVVANLSTGETLETAITVKTDEDDDGGDDGNKDDGKSGTGLPGTGGNVWPGAAVALGALVGGVVLMYVSKRRSSATA